jgi:hypothetical protein
VKPLPPGRTRQTRLRRHLKKTGIVLMVLLAGAGWFLMRPLPRPLLRLALVASAPLLLSDFRPDDSTITGRAELVAARLWGNFLSFNLASAYADAAPPGDARLSDVDFVFARLATLRGAMLSQNELKHPARNWFSLFSGLGYCDQLNRTAALVLAHRFGHAQTYAISAADPTKGHVIGRVWSRDLGDWLYFDLWPVNIVVFRYDARIGVQPLRTACAVPPRDVPSQDGLAAELYKRIPLGTVLNEYPTSFGAYLWSRRRTDTRMIGASAVAEYPDVAETAAADTIFDASFFARPLPLSSAVARDYMRHRMDLLLGGRSLAAGAPLPASTLRGDVLLREVESLLERKVRAEHVGCGEDAGHGAAASAG